MLHIAHMAKAEPSGVAGPLSLPALITCLEERIAVMRKVGMVGEIGSLPELLEETVQFLQTVRDGEPSSLADDLMSRLQE